MSTKGKFRVFCLKFVFWVRLIGLKDLIRGLGSILGYLGLRGFG